MSRLVRVIGNGDADFEVNPTGLSFVLRHSYELRGQGLASLAVVVSEDHDRDDGATLVQILLDYVPRRFIRVTKDEISFGKTDQSLEPLNEPPDGLLAQEEVVVGWGAVQQKATLVVTAEPLVVLAGWGRSPDEEELTLVEVGIKVVPEGEPLNDDRPYMAHLYIKVPERLVPVWKEKAYEGADAALQG